ncbi:protein translocase subunit SecF [Laspinema olomoucense]|uniref:Protein-export membrane protein SecF n=1 Tax=Laspinema olomoucense D3b TaxID=2953688 RepID=A0ABT2N575_9CYAN|nr:MULTISPECIES: protein translocase subunit SecF [unclassified Laspinema]MCT7974131.1 protein translocase subunit SecF [Laspinema sp. D3d]MCT7977024.1 protein translocase subunit SecF [Laspinema sp. D3b]MCT7987440.1 protein translocase subunit SecF [Laspinema sp. D3a]MCT7993530.1 protein translocase subunit SecF [Laspinema sp. D3c]
MRLNVNKQRRLWWTLSAAVVVAGLISMVISWQQLGAPVRPSLDFVGGTRLQLELDCSVPNNCDRPIESGQVRSILASQGLGSSSIQVVGESQQALSIRTSNLDVDQRTELVNSLTEELGSFDPQKSQIDTVGPTLGRQLFTQGLLALIISFAGIIVYLSFRFQFDYALFAIVALFHDVAITVGIFSILGLVLGLEADSLFIVALLTIIGFSVNDTVVIYDRIRETLAQDKLNRPIDQIVDDAVNQTLGRSINTTATTMLPLVGIFLFGGETLKSFALALIVGFLAGVYSSLFLASSLLVWWRERNGQGMSPVPEGSTPVDASPDSNES